MKFRSCLALLFLQGSWAAEKYVSISDCRYSVDPEAFLGRAARIRSDANQRALKVSAPGAGRQAAASPRNFIDEEIFARLEKRGIAPAALAPDEEFVRRIFLDLTGRLPAPAEVREFAADRAEDKRDKLIDRLLESPEFTDRWTLWMGDLLQNTSTLVNAAVNRGAQGRNAFHAYIRQAVAAGKPLNTLATELVAGRGNTFDNAAGMANFPLGASTSMGPAQDTYDTMLVKTATTFLGLGSFDCLLCHNGRGRLTGLNLWGSRQTRVDAWEMAAFFSRMAFTASQPRGSFLIEDAASGGYDLNTDSGNRSARTPVGPITSVTPVYRETRETPAGGSWREAFAASMVKDPMFARNMANRIWKQMFGLGLVEPVDSMDPARLDPANPPEAPWELQASHPELLEKLAAELARGGYRLRPFLRTLAQSSSYQLGSRFEGEWKEEYVALFAKRIPRRLEAEEVHDAIAKATGVLADYALQSTADRVTWAVQLPEPTEPASVPDRPVAAFLNTFLRGDRDTQERSQAGSIQQQLALMNDPFVLDRLRVASAPRLRAMAEIANNADLVEEMYLTFLSRRPSEAEKSTGVAFLAKAGDRNDAVSDMAWMCINKVEFLFSH